MKYFRGLKISLVAKLVLAFVLVAVIPMLVASKITTELIPIAHLFALNHGMDVAIL